MRALDRRGGDGAADQEQEGDLRGSEGEGRDVGLGCKFGEWDSVLLGFCWEGCRCRRVAVAVAVAVAAVLFTIQVRRVATFAVRCSEKALSSSLYCPDSRGRAM